MKWALAWLCCENSHTRKHNSASYARYKNTGCFAVLTASGKALATKLLWSKSSLVNRTLSPEGTVQTPAKEQVIFIIVSMFYYLKTTSGNLKIAIKHTKAFYDVDMWVD